MTIENKLAEALEHINALSIERDDLRATVEKLTIGAASELEVAKADIVSKDARIAELTDGLDKANAIVQELTEKVSALEQSKISASKEAAKIAASVGVEPVELSPADSKPTPEAVDHLATFLSMPVGSKERNEYFAAHKHELLKAAI